MIINDTFKSTCAIAVSTDLLGDKWSLLILRDMLLHRKSTYKDFLNSREKIATNILANRLKNLREAGYIAKLDPDGPKIKTVYFATSKGIDTLPLIIELYKLSINDLPESILDESQLTIKAQIAEDSASFISTRREKYIEFVDQLKSQLIAKQK